MAWPKRGQAAHITSHHGHQVAKVALRKLRTHGTTKRGRTLRNMKVGPA